MSSNAKNTARIRALLSRAEHPATPAAEAQAAAAKAAELMVRHAISEATVRAEAGHSPEPIELDGYDVAGTGGHGKARAAALVAIATAYGCEVAVYGNDASRCPRRLLIVGTRSALAALRILLPSIELRMESAARAATRAYGGQLRAADSGQDPSRRRTCAAAFRRDYLRGYGYGVADRIRTMRGGIDQEVTGTGTALVLAGDAARVQAAFTREFPGLSRTRADRRRHPSAQSQGREEGSRADIGTNFLGSGTSTPSIGQNRADFHESI